MSRAAILLAALLTGEPSVVLPPNPLWSTCEQGDPAARIEVCGRIADDATFDMRARAWALVLKADAYQQAGEASAAIGALDRAIRMEPTEWVAFRLRGLIHLEQERLPAALQDLDHAIDLQQGDPFNFLARAAYCRESGEYSTARQDIDRAITLDPDLPESFFDRGRVAVAAGDAEQAILDFSKFKEMSPSEAAADYNLALAYRLAGRLLEADEAVGRFVDAEPEDPDGYRQRAFIRQDLGELDSALADIETAMTLAPGDLKLFYDRGMIYRDRGEWNKAVDDLGAALPAFPNDSTLLTNRGFCNYRAGNDEAALVDAEAALSIDPGDPVAHWLKASALFYLERIEDGFAATTRGLEIEPDSVDLLVIRGRLQLAQNNVIGAISSLFKATQLDPSSLEATTYSAAAAAVLGRDNYAAEVLAGILETNPSYGLALEEIVPILYRIGDVQGALSAATSLTQLFPEDGVQWWRKGEILRALEYDAPAMEAYEEALRRYENETPVALLRDYAGALLAAEHPADAIPLLERALKAEPDHAWTNGQLGKAYYTVDRFEEAATAFLHAVDLYADEEEADSMRLHLARSYQRLGRYDDSLREYNALVEEGYREAVIFEERGHAFHSAERYAKALADAEAALDLEPDRVSALLLKAKILNAKGEHTAMLAVLAKAIVAAPEDPNPYFARAEFRYGNGNFELALEDYDRAIARAPRKVLYLNIRADVLLRLGRLTEAREAALWATSVEPDYAYSWITLGEILLESGDAKEAVNAFDRGLALYPTLAYGLYYRAVAHAQLGNADDARRDLTKASTYDDGSFSERIAELRRDLS